MRAFARDDGLFDVEAHLVDTKPFPIFRMAASEETPAGQALHDLWVRITIDTDYVVRGVEAKSDVTPWELCKSAEATLRKLIGEKVVSGWSMKVKERLRGAAGCTHLTEMMVTMGTTAYQGINGLRETDRLASTPGADRRVDTCFAYQRGGEVVRMLWPQHYSPPDSARTS